MNYSEQKIKCQDRRDLGTFIPSYLDDYGLTAAEFRLYAHMGRRAGSGKCWESIPNMAKHCAIAEKVVRRDLRILVEFGMVAIAEEKPGYATQYVLTHPSDWASPDDLEKLRERAGKVKKMFQPAKKTGKPRTEAKKVVDAVAQKVETAIERPIEKTHWVQPKMEQRPIHPAHIYGSDRPWLIEPTELEPIAFDEVFLEWGGKKYLAEYKKHNPDLNFYEAKSNFNKFLINHPDKIAATWKAYRSEVAHKAVTMVARENGGVAIASEEKESLARHHKALQDATPNDLTIDPAIAQSAGVVVENKFQSSDTPTRLLNRRNQKAIATNKYFVDPLIELNLNLSSLTKRRFYQEQALKMEANGYDCVRDDAGLISEVIDVDF